MIELMSSNDKVNSVNKVKKLPMEAKDVTNMAHPVLCGGTFLTLILQSRKPTASRRERTQGATDIFREPDVLFELIKIVQPDYIRPAGNTFRTYTTNYKRCTEHTPNDLKFENESVISAFLARLETDYAGELTKMAAFINHYIDVGTTAQNDVLLVKRLFELIRDDESIPAMTQFAVCKDGTLVDKRELVCMTEVYLPAFLLSVWKFIVTERKDNSIGSGTISTWQHPMAQGRYVGIDGSTIKQNIKVVCDVIVGSVDSADRMLEVEEMIAATAEKFEMPDVYTYLRSAEEKYSTIKTLLYSDEPKPFYSFYVCNTIRYRDVGIQTPRRSMDMSILENATVDKIRKISRFIIISGTGGLGKSMMMRHLMLNAIANFDDLKLFPVFIPLKDFCDTSLFDYIYSKISVFDSEITTNQFEQLLTHGSCLLLLDGLDEIAAGRTERFERELEELTDKYSNNMFILSSRPFQAFVSYERFSLLRLMPFDRRQAMQLINRLEFRPDEPAIKEKFQAALEKTLFRTHRSFTENPLLLTIMLLTFEQYAEVPSKMHIFYREAFEVLAKRHDASKGAYKRALKTGLSVDTLSDYFAELCFRSYKDEKFELTAEEFTGYFNALNARATVNDKKTTASDFLEDLCSNLCLLYFEGNSYHFTHRSFQEYFCALFFSKQKDKFIAKLGDFFEKHRRRMYGDRTFYMLYDMATEKVEEYIFLPFLSSLFDKCEKADGYWTFLEEMHPQITYSSEDEYLFPRRVVESHSFLLDAVLDIIGFNGRERFGRDTITLVKLPYYEELEIEKIPHYRQRTLFDSKHEEYDIEEVEDGEAGYVCRFMVAEVRQRTDDFEDLLNALNDDKFVFKKQYYAAYKYMKELIAKQKNEDDSLLDLL